MSLPLTGQVSFNDVRVEFSQSISPNYAMSDWVAGAWLSQSISLTGTTVSNVYSPVNLQYLQNFGVSGVNTASRLDPYLNNSMSIWYGYNHSESMSDQVLVSGDYIYSHVSNNHCTPSTMIPVNVGTQDRILFITISGSAENFSEDLYVFYGKPWESNGTGSGTYQLITASGHSFSPYTGDINLDFSWDYRYTASLGQYVYFVLYGNYCVSNPT